MKSEINHKTEVGEIKDHILFENENVKLIINGWKPYNYKTNEYSGGVITLYIKDIITILITPEWNYDDYDLLITEEILDKIKPEE